MRLNKHNKNQDIKTKKLKLNVMFDRIVLNETFRISFLNNARTNKIE